MKYPDDQPAKLKKAEWLAQNPICQTEVCCTRPFEEAFRLSQLHFHEFVEVGIVVAGSGCHRVWDRAVPCRKGDVFIINAGVPHAFFAKGEGSGLTVHNLLFDAQDWFDGELADPESSRFCYGVFEESLLAASASLGARQLEDTLQLCEQMAQECRRRAPYWREMVCACLAAFLIGMARLTGEPAPPVPPPDAQDQRVVAAVMRTVMERYGEKELTLEKVAGALYLSRSHLSRVFSRVTGQTFSQYLREVRLQQACRLLQTTDMTNEQIVFACGLKDLPSFYRLFRRERGATPYRYRTAHAAANIQNHDTQEGEHIMTILSEISENLQHGKAKVVKEKVQQAVDAGIPVEQILNEGLLHGMGIIGEKFKNNEVYVPEVLVAARAMNMGAQVLKPLMAAAGVKATGKVCIGTVQGDLHDIGKNLVKMMMEGKGLEVVDLGTDVSPKAYVEAAVQQGCQVICCSALLTTTMGVMREVVREAEAAGIRDKVKIMIGGAPVTQAFCDEIGADKYTPDAASAADAAVAFCAAQ